MAEIGDPGTWVLQTLIWGILHRFTEQFSPRNSLARSVLLPNTTELGSNRGRIQTQFCLATRLLTGSQKAFYLRLAAILLSSLEVLAFSSVAPGFD